MAFINKAEFNYLARVRYVADGIAKNYSFHFGYIDSKHIHVEKDGVKMVEGTDYTFSNQQEIEFSVVPTLGQIIYIYRTTPIINQIVEFKDLSTLKADQLNNSALQALYSMQEVYDEVTESMTKNSNGDWDAANSKIVNLADGDEDDHAVNIGQLKKIFEDVWKTVQPVITEIRTKHDDVVVKHGDIVDKYNEIISMYNDIKTKVQDAIDAANDAKRYRDEASGFSSSASGHADRAKTEADRAIGYSDESKNHSDKSKKWANEDEDTVVENGEYSAKHWAMKSKGYATGGVEEAPVDGKLYGRKDATWEEVKGSDTGGVEEAPADGKLYGRKNKSWEEVTGGGGGDITALENEHTKAHIEESSNNGSAFTILNKLRKLAIKFSFDKYVSTAAYNTPQYDLMVDGKKAVNVNSTTEKIDFKMPISVNGKDIGGGAGGGVGTINGESPDDNGDVAVKEMYVDGKKSNGFVNANYNNYTKWDYYAKNNKLFKTLRHHHSTSQVQDHVTEERYSFVFNNKTLWSVDDDDSIPNFPRLKVGNYELPAGSKIGTVKSVNKKEPDIYGNVNLDLGLDKVVKTVNGHKPDAKGDVLLTILRSDLAVDKQSYFNVASRADGKYTWFNWRTQDSLANWTLHVSGDNKVWNSNMNGMGIDYKLYGTPFMTVTRDASTGKTAFAPDFPRGITVKGKEVGGIPDAIMKDNKDELSTQLVAVDDTKLTGKFKVLAQKWHIFCDKLKKRVGIDYGEFDEFELKKDLKSVFVADKDGVIDFSETPTVNGAPIGSGGLAKEGYNYLLNSGLLPLHSPVIGNKAFFDIDGLDLGSWLSPSIPAALFAPLNKGETIEPLTGGVNKFVCKEQQNDMIALFANKEVVTKVCEEKKGSMWASFIVRGTGGITNLRASVGMRKGTSASDKAVFFSLKGTLIKVEEDGTKVYRYYGMKDCKSIVEDNFYWNAVKSYYSADCGLEIRPYSSNKYPAELHSFQLGWTPDEPETDTLATDINIGGISTCPVGAANPTSDADAELTRYSLVQANIDMYNLYDKWVKGTLPMDDNGWIKFARLKGDKWRYMKAWGYLVVRTSISDRTVKLKMPVRTWATSGSDPTRDRWLYTTDGEMEKIKAKIDAGVITQADLRHSTSIFSAFPNDGIFD